MVDFLTAVLTSAKVHAKYGSTDVMLPGLFREMEKIVPLIPAKGARN